MEREYVPVEQVAETAGVTVRTVQRWLAEERIPTFQQGDRRRRYLRRDDAEWLVSPRVVERRRHEAGPVRA